MPNWLPDRHTILFYLIELDGLDAADAFIAADDDVGKQNKNNSACVCAQTSTARLSSRDDGGGNELDEGRDFGQLTSGLVCHSLADTKVARRSSERVGQRGGILLTTRRAPDCDGWIKPVILVVEVSASLRARRLARLRLERLRWRREVNICPDVLSVVCLRTTGRSGGAGDDEAGIIERVSQQALCSPV